MTDGDVRLGELRDVLLRRIVETDLAALNEQPDRRCSRCDIGDGRRVEDRIARHLLHLRDERAIPVGLLVDDAVALEMEHPARQLLRPDGLLDCRVDLPENRGVEPGSQKNGQEQVNHAPRECRMSTPKLTTMSVSRRVTLAVALVFAALSALGQSISTVAGGGTDDGHAATDVGLFGVVGLTLDGAGNLYIVEQLANQTRKVAPDGTISTVAGNGGAGFGGDG